ncbi:MAG: tetratricopeptide repeat protein [Verrucomicrobia bacterium]|jgi:tetratricopeptide (TPR) repeat protein|nr:MAG: tetratricopeptide repeat protein [Verrucomicrobiota bacterium]
MQARQSRLEDKLIFLVRVIMNISQRIGRRLVHLPALVTFDMSQIVGKPSEQMFFDDIDNTTQTTQSRHSRMKTTQIFTRLSRTFCLIALSIFIATTQTKAAEPQAEASGSSNETLRSYLQLQEQLHATQLALERNRQETEALAARNAEAVAARFKAIEAAVSTQRLAEMDSMQKTLHSNNRWMLIVGGSIASVGFFVLLATGYLQWRSVNRLAEFSTLIQSARTALVAPAPSQTETQLLGTGEIAQSNGRLFGALTQLEKRIHELEHTAHLPTQAQAITVGTGNTGGDTETHSENSSHSDHNSLLMAKGQSLLNMEKSADALACFEEILKGEPNHAEALVKKGIALEDLRQTDEAIRCYDRAIESNGDLTIAYLQKGGLFNRLERYEEALQCYEQALHAQEKAQMN